MAKAESSSDAGRKSRWLVKMRLTLVKRSMLIFILLKTHDPSAGLSSGFEDWALKENP